MYSITKINDIDFILNCEPLTVNVENCIRLKLFYIKPGIRQGGILPPLLFNAYSELIIRNVLVDYNEGFPNR